MQMRPLARALVDAGHHICFAVPPSLGGVLATEGFCSERIVPELDELSDIAAASRPDWERWTPDRRALFLFAVLWPSLVLAQLKRLIVDWNADLVIYEEGEFAGPLAAAKTSRASASLGWPGPARTDANIRAISPVLEDLWSSEGLGHIPVSHRLYGDCSIRTCPPSLDREMPPSAILMRAGGGISSCPSNWEHPPYGRRMAHATLGTVAEYASAANIFDQIVTGARSADLSLILSVGPELDPSRWHDPVHDIYAFNLVPHDEVIPQAMATILHGGAGTFWRALSHGCPLLVLPRGGASQFRNARACVRRGVGLALEPTSVSAESVASSLKLLEQSPHYRHAAHSVACEIEAMPRAESAVLKLEAIVSERQSTKH
ncbi:MAG: hypothetical protein KKB66_11255 [Alphaproteobacteria bacterium]|nr:hypothetical protein [Alphaproteobacteria bacterium]MBU0804977.1 hypothetical protein [Alphaproteobacteria bacterium]MBU0870476.1 hypothetical protein [Alphaproteobacteria bacterium]MBU1401849.1 hypothetical protein [Alphaproteobacteria bacterium]MBU1591734.1 hypothetical protein [Alphaproteobacteria bacterium]